MSVNRCRLLLLIVFLGAIPSCDPSTESAGPTPTPAPTLAAITDELWSDMNVPWWNIDGPFKTDHGWRMWIEGEIHNQGDRPAVPVCYLGYEGPLRIIYFRDPPPRITPRDWTSLQGSAYVNARPRGDSNGIYCRALGENESLPEGP